MKKSLFIPLLLYSLFAYSQNEGRMTIIKFKLNGDRNITTEPLILSNLKPPIQFIFSANFDGKSVSISDSNNMPLAPKIVKFGDSNLQKDGEDNTYRIEINTDRSVNPGDNDKINLDKFILQIEQKKFNVSLSPVSSNLVVDSDPKKDEAYKAGYVFYDVIKLLDSKTITQTKKEILDAYGVNDTNINDNPFLNDIYGKGPENINLPQGVGVSKLLGSIGNTDVTNFASGLARILAERAKEELNEAFFKKMKDQLTVYPELKTVFPKTASFLDQIETFSYMAVLNALKDAFEMDIQSLPENLYNIKELSPADCRSSISSDLGKKAKCDINLPCSKCKICKCEERLIKLNEYFATQSGQWVALGMLSAKEGIQSTNPADLIKTIVSSDEFKNIKDSSSMPGKHNDYNILSSIELSNFISQSLISKDEKQVWISKSQLDTLFMTPNAFKVYLGLLLSFEQRKQDMVVIKFYKDDSTSETITFGNILKDGYGVYESQISGLIKNTFNVYNATNIAVKKMIAAADKSVEVEPQALYEYYRTLTASLKPLAHSQLLDSLIRKDFGTKFDRVEQILNPAVDIAYHISTKKYSAAIYDASILLDALNEFKVTKVGTDTTLKPYDGFKQVTKSFVKYGTLISTVASAESSDEVKKALDASILPVGSSSIKRKSAWSISVNGYVGGFYGQAYSTTQDTSRNTATNTLDTITKSVTYETFGVYAPIGMSFSRGTKCGIGFSLTAQILDLGALVNFYLTEGDEASLPTDFTVKLSDILSPGLQVGVNLPKTPLTLIGGLQYVPALNNSSQISSSQLSPVAWRFQIGVVVDIPLYNLKVWDFKK